MWWRLHSVEGTDFVQLNSLDEELWERRYHFSWLNTPLLISTQSDWSEIEEEVLKGQKLQGLSTLKEVYQCLRKRVTSDDELIEKFPLFRRIYRISFLEDPLPTLFQW